MATVAFVVAAPGYYGDETTVISSHRTVAAAKRAVTWPGECVRMGSLQKGDTFRRSSEAIYPIAKG